MGSPPIFLTIFCWVLVLTWSSVFAEIANGYGYQTGHISMNDSEITILINSTFEIIEDFENDTDIFAGVPTPLSTNEPTPTTSEVGGVGVESDGDSEGRTTRRNGATIRMRKIRPSTCTKYTESQKYQLLEEAGGRNQLFQADSVDEAGKNFASTFSFPTPVSSPMMILPVQDQIDYEADCDARCRLIKTILNQEIEKRGNSTSTSSSKKKFSHSKIQPRQVFDDAPPQACSLGNFIPVGSCTDLGEMAADGEHESLCSECRGLYMLTTNCFPRIFNAVQCNSQEMGCIFDTFTDKAHGQCSFQSLSFKVLRNLGDDACEDWNVEQLELPVACQCSLSKSSFLRTKPNKEL